MRGLVLAEKPSLMRAIQSAYSAGGFPFTLDFAAFHGHLMGLAQPSDYHEEWRKWDLAALPIIPDSFKYLPVDKPSVDKIMGKIKAGKYDFWSMPVTQNGKGSIYFGPSTRQTT